VEYPRTTETEFPELYEELDDLLERIEGVLRSNFEVQEFEASERVLFAAAGVEDYLDAMWADSEAMVPFFQKVTGLPDREFDRQHGVRNIGSKLSGRKTDFRDEEDARVFAQVVSDLLPEDLAMETLLYTFVTMWENDQRRHYRARYESEVLEFVRERGYPAKKGSELPGEPDLVVPDTEPYRVTGEIRVIQRKDKKKRFKEFGTEARAAKENFPGARFVVVANVGSYITTVDREELREEIHEEASGPIDLVAFQDELEILVERLHDWGVGTD